MSYSLRMTRRDERRRLTDRCRITEPGEGQVWNDNTGRSDPAPEVTVAEGRCAAAVTGTNERVVEVGGAPVTLRTLKVDLHYAIEGDIRVGQRFTLTKSANRHLLDRSWHIIDVVDGSWSVARGLTVQEEMPT